MSANGFMRSIGARSVSGLGVHHAAPPQGGESTLGGCGGSQPPLSPVQQDILDLIIQDQRAVQRAAEPEHVILLWFKGRSEKQTARELRISEHDVRLIRQRWWDARGR